MWNRKELKQKAKVSFKKNYWAAVAVCFLMAVLIGEYGTSMSGIEKYDPRIDIAVESEVYFLLIVMGGLWKNFCIHMEG